MTDPNHPLWPKKWLTNFRPRRYYAGILGSCYFAAQLVSRYAQRRWYSLEQAVAHKFRRSLNPFRSLCDSRDCHLSEGWQRHSLSLISLHSLWFFSSRSSRLPTRIYEFFCKSKLVLTEALNICYSASSGELFRIGSVGARLF